MQYIFTVLTKVKYNSDVIAKSTKVRAREEGRGRWRQRRGGVVESISKSSTYQFIYIKKN